LGGTGRAGALEFEADGAIGIYGDQFDVAAVDDQGGAEAIQPGFDGFTGRRR
jgi:hypothetical protein